ncbi:MAG: ABC transporter permease subunit [Lachnospiraceae bacterium]|nr:ABC transporter permease subunit [Lachnospiraceae bacterium]
MKSMKSLPKFLRKLIVLLCLIALWWAISAVIKKDVLIPSPLQVARKFLFLTGTKAFYQSVFLSVFRILTGFLLAVLLGILCGSLGAFFDLAGEFLTPILSVIKATPVASFIILALVFINKELIPVFISFLMVFPVIFENVKTGIQKADENLIEMGHFFHLSKAEITRHIYVPEVAPYFFAGAKTCLGLAWKAGVAAEVLCFPTYSIGKNLYNAKVYLETDSLFAWTILVIFISMCIEALVSKLIQIYEKGRVLNHDET